MEEPLRREALAPAIDVVGREERDDGRDDLACATTVERRAALKDKRTFVTLRVRQDNIAELGADGARRRRHQRDPALVIRLGKRVRVRKLREAAPVDPHDDPRISQQRVVRLKVPHIFVLALGHGAHPRQDSKRQRPTLRLHNGQHKGIIIKRRLGSTRQIDGPKLLVRTCHGALQEPLLPV